MILNMSTLRLLICDCIPTKQMVMSYSNKNVELYPTCERQKTIISKGHPSKMDRCEDLGMSVKYKLRYSQNEDTKSVTRYATIAK